MKCVDEKFTVEIFCCSIGQFGEVRLIEFEFYALWCLGNRAFSKILS